MAKLIACLLTLFCTFCSSISQAQPADKTAALPSPLPEIAKALQGKWLLSVKFEPASGLPAGTQGSGEETWRTAVGGKTLLSEESWNAGAAQVSVLGILWWDSREQKLHAMDCNDQGKAVCDPSDAAGAVVVRWDGTNLVIEEPERGPDNRMVTSRVTFTDIKPQSFTEVGALETSPGKFATMMTIHATRAGG
jgi:hypothetical protein